MTSWTNYLVTNMELLLDTCTFLYAIFDDEKLPKHIKDIISNPDNDVFVSIASLWEIAIKNSKRPETMPYSVEEICNLMNQTDYSFLPIHYTHFFNLKEIIAQQIHRDPFDHLLLATAKSENFHLITCDENMKKYNDVMLLSY